MLAWYLPTSVTRLTRLVIRKGRTTVKLRALATAAIAAAGLVLVPAAPAAASHSSAFPTTINLPVGFQPEGITIGPGPFAYFGSLADGRIYRANLVTGEGRVISPALVPPRPSVGLKSDGRSRLYVAGGVAGSGRVVDIRSGAVLREYQFATGPEATFVNDVVLTPTAAWFTDSRRKVLYQVPIDRHGRPADTFNTLALTGDFPVDPALFNANGIARTPDGRGLLLIHSTLGQLWRVDPRSGATSQVDVGGAELTNGDGLLVLGRTLYVVRNRVNVIVVIDLNKAGTKGTVRKEIRDARFDVPTTVAAFGNRLYLPNARFGTATPTPAEATYTAVAVRK
jgi:sugar lactone lactonase YvrE